MKLLAAVLLLLTSLPLSGAAFVPPETIRVAVLKGVDSLKLEGKEALALNESREPVRLTLPVQLRADRRGISIDGTIVRKLTISAALPLQVNGKSYRGVIEITPSDRGLLVVNELPLEDYLVGLINCEISSQWPIEAVKAQAVVARSYALYQKEARSGATYHLESSVLDQVYEGSDIEDSRAARAVHDTAGEVLTFNGKVIQAFFHSNCGGHTEAAENVWGVSLPYLQGVACKYCAESPSVHWGQSLPLKKIESQLKNGGVTLSGLKDIRPGRRNKSGRLMEVSLVARQGSQDITGAKFRKLVGFTVIKSTNFDVKVSGDDALFTGAGYGHGVGLCQWGAKNRALDGFDYREIITYYYPGARIEKLYTD